MKIELTTAPTPEERSALVDKLKSFKFTNVGLYHGADLFLEFAAEKGIISSDVVAYAKKAGWRYNTAAKVCKEYPDLLAQWAVMQRMGLRK